MNLTNCASLVSLVVFSIATVACSGDASSSSDSPYGPSSSGSYSSSGSSGSSGSSAGDEHPSWLVGPSWTKGYKTENNIAFESDDSGLKLDGAPDYKIETKTGKTWSKSGTWKVTSHTQLVLGSETINLSSAMTANCRILKTSSGKVLYTSSKVKGCPFAKPLSSAECHKTGSYSKSSTSGSTSSSLDTSSSYDLDADGVLVFTSGTTQTTCYGSTCKSLANYAAPAVSRWWLSGSTVVSDGSQSVSLTGYTFSPSSDACPN
jgi:hypothetical protein